jgi:VWFA-related protein
MMKRGCVALAFAVALLAQQPPHLRADVNLVRVPCAVRDANGAPAQGLRGEDFVVLDDGVPQPVKYVWQELDLPLTVGLISDCPCLVASLFDPPRQSLMQFVTRVVSPEDRAFLVSVGRQQRLVADFTNSAESLRAGLRGLDQQTAAVLGEACSGTHLTKWSQSAPPCGGETLWNGVFFAARLKMGPQSGRKAMLLFTDGRDTGSDHGLSDAIEACQGAGTVVYSIRYGPLKHGPRAATIFANIVSPPTIFLDKDPNPEFTKARRELERIARETGGLAFDGEYYSKPDRLTAIFDRIESDLRSQYVLAYRVPSAHAPGSYHRISVKVRRPGLTVRARPGYYAP